MEEHLFSLAALGALCGAIAGSFLNVVIHRTPLLIEYGERSVSPLQYLRGLSWPASHCPCCKAQLRWYDNIPILSYIVLRGRCRACAAPYGARYLVVESLSALAVASCVLQFGATATAVFSSIFVLGLLALTFIDLEEQLLPDAIVFPLLLLGIVFNGIYRDALMDASSGALVGFSVLWLIRASYQAYAGIEGLGYGDLKLAAMIGAWLGLAAVPAVLFMAFAIGVVLMAPMLLAGNIDQRTAVPFGPFLAVSAASVLVLPRLAGLPFNLFAF